MPSNGIGRKNRRTRISFGEILKTLVVFGLKYGRNADADLHSYGPLSSHLLHQKRITFIKQSVYSSLKLKSDRSVLYSGISPSQKHLQEKQTEVMEILSL